MGASDRAGGPGEWSFPPVLFPGIVRPKIAPVSPDEGTERKAPYAPDRGVESMVANIEAGGVAALRPLASRAGLRRRATAVVLIYATAAGAWIALSDRVLGLVVQEPEVLVRLSVYKGLAFVGATAALLHVMLRRTAGTVGDALTEVERKEIERRAHEEQRERADAILESTNDAIISTALDGTITRWNPAAERKFGYSADEMLGRSADILIPMERRDEELGILRRIAAGEQVERLETVRLRKDGSSFFVAVTFSPIWGFDEAAPRRRVIQGMSAIVRDVSERKRMEAIAESERRFATSLVEAMPGIFYLYDEKGRFLRWNRNFERISGYTAEEIEHMHPLDFFADHEKGLLEERIATVFEAGEASVEASFVAKDGTTTPYFFTGRRIVLDGARCLIGVGVDIADHKRAELALARSEERYRTTLDSILEGCQLLDFDWRYLYLNGAAAVQNRRPNEELLGKRMPEVWPGIEATPAFGMLSRCMNERVPIHDETEFTFPDGRSGWFDIRVQPVPEGIFVLSIDISERRAAERALKEMNQSLERKVAERTRDLELARERAESADRIKSAFLATMSHELRTPLNSIIGFTGIVLQGLAGPLTSEQSKQLGMVKSSARHLLDLINDVLDISKIEAGQLEIRLTPFDLRLSVEHVAASIAPLAEKKGLELHTELPDAPLLIESDARRVEQIVLNLLNNAIKFTDRGQVTAKLDLVGPDVRIQVIDTGIGMKHEDLSLLFQPFRQLDSGLQRQHEGTGLGLAICRRLTELLGGTIRAESTLGRGSVFTLTLPRKRA